MPSITNPGNSNLTPHLFIPRRTTEMTTEDIKTNFLAIQQWADIVNGGAGHRYATVVVAQSGGSQPSLHSSQADADYICTGSNDDVTIQNAINSMTSGSGGAPCGLLLLMEGDYNFGTGTTGLNGKFIDIMGLSNSLTNFGTTLTVPTGCTNSFSVLKGFNRVSNLEVQVGDNATRVIKVVDDNGNTQNTSEVFIQGSLTLAAGSYGISVNTTANVRNCFVIDMAVGYIFQSGVSYGTVHDNYSQGCTVGVQVDNHNNIVHGHHSHGDAKGIVLVSTAQDNTIQSNDINNHTSAALVVDGTNNNVQGNTLRKGGTTPANGLFINATANTCIVINNDCHASGTANFTDNGAGTIKNLDGSANNWNRTT